MLVFYLKESEMNNHYAHTLFLLLRELNVKNFAHNSKTPHNDIHLHILEIFYFF